MIFISITLTTIFTVMKLSGLIGWYWWIIAAPVMMDAAIIIGAKSTGKDRYLNLMLCNPLKIRGVMKSNMTRKAS